MTAQKTQLRGLSLSEITELCLELGAEAYRGRQLYEWLFLKRAETLDAIHILPAALRKALSDRAEIAPLEIARKQTSADGTVKFLFRLADKREIESVLIPSETLDEKGRSKRRTLCVSTQVGCPLDCRFCATGTMRFGRNLSSAEILSQLLQVQNASEDRITNLVFMGMGEPLLNYDNVMKAVEIMCSEEHQLLGPRRVTLSTSGIMKGIYRMADENRPIKLAISLHATTDGVRSTLMPINKKFNLKLLGEAVEYYYRKTRMPLTYEYILFEGLNDSFLDAKRLAKVTRRVPSKVNVIPFHTIDFTAPAGVAASLKPAPAATFERFIAELQSLGVTVMIRSSSGKDIQAACGQLALASKQAVAAG